MEERKKMEEKGTSITIENEYGKYTTSLKEGDLDLDAMCQLFEQVLRGAGYYFDGTVDIVNEEDTSCECEEKKED